MAAEPVALQKEDPNVTKQDWYQQAIGKVENMHFSTPHIQNLFDDTTRRYYWVISLSLILIGKILFFYDIIINGIGYLPHTDKIILQIFLGLFHQLFRILYDFLPG